MRSTALPVGRALASMYPAGVQRRTSGPRTSHGSPSASTKRAVGQVLVRRRVPALPLVSRVDPLGMELLVHRVGAALSWVHRPPDLHEAVVVGSTTQRAGSVAGGECRRLVEEEELGEAAGLHQRRAVPSAVLELTGDPALHAEAPTNAPVLVVQAAAVPVDEAASRIRDEVAERGDAVLSRHRAGTVPRAG